MKLTDRLLQDHGPHVRVISRGLGFDSQIVVQQRGRNAIEWADVRSFDPMSDDYAHSNARDFAITLTRATR